MNNLFISIIGFVICSIVIIYSGSKLSYYGDQIAIKTNMGKDWVGLILLATVTSLPELYTGISSVAIIKEPDLTAGDILAVAFSTCLHSPYLILK